MFVNIILFAQVSFTQLGTDIDGEAIYDHNGSSTSLSSDGTVIAIGANNHGNGVNAGHSFLNIGIQIGQDIDAAIDQSKS